MPVGLSGVLTSALCHADLAGVAVSTRGFILLEYSAALRCISVTDSLSPEAMHALLGAGGLAPPLLVHDSITTLQVGDSLTILQVGGR